MNAVKTIAVALASILFAWVNLLAQAQSPTDQHALEQMAQALQGNILALAIPYTADTLQFDAQGKLVGKSSRTVDDVQCAQARQSFGEGFFS